MSGQTCALIGADNVVFNIIVIDGDFAAEGVTAVKSSVAQIGDTYEPLNGEFSRPAPPDPQELRELMPPISKRQLRLTLVRNDVSLADLDAAILAMGDEAIIEWQDASEYRRLHPLLNQVAAHLSLSQEQVDGMWQQALSA